MPMEHRVTLCSLPFLFNSFSLVSFAGLFLSLSPRFPLLHRLARDLFLIVVFRWFLLVLSFLVHVLLAPPAHLSPRPDSSFLRAQLSSLARFAREIANASQFPASALARCLCCNPGCKASYVLRFSRVSAADIYCCFDREVRQLCTLHPATIAV